MYVIMIHVLSDCINDYMPGSFLSAASFFLSRSLTFAVPAFIMSSGIKMLNKFSGEPLYYFKFIAGRINKIYIPYILWSIIYYLYFVFHRHYFDFSIVDLLGYLLTGDIAAPFYFIIVIMQFYLLMPLWLSFCKRIRPSAGILTAAALTVLSKYLARNIEINSKVFTNTTILNFCYNSFKFLYTFSFTFNYFPTNTNGIPYTEFW